MARARRVGRLDLPVVIPAGRLDAVLANGLDRAAPPAEAVPVMLHPNLRGPRDFH